MRNRLLRRLPLLVVLAAGIVLWNSPLFPQSRELTWRLPEDRAGIESVEIQLWDSAHRLVQREQVFGGRAGGEILERVSLAKGLYIADIFIRRNGQENHLRLDVSVGDENAYMLTIP